jgi:hypothetical protein
VVEGAALSSRRLDRNPQSVFYLFLADEVTEPSRPQGQIVFG